MDPLGCLFDADSCLSFGFKWKLILVVALAAAGAFGGWSLGLRLDMNWGSEFMAFLLAFLGLAICLVIGVWLVRPAAE